MINQLWVSGDPITDVFNHGIFLSPDFKTLSTVIKPGGAANTLANAQTALANTGVRVSKTWLNAPLRYERFIDNGELVLRSWPKPLNRHTTMLSAKTAFAAFKSIEHQAIIISDYNKGCVNSYTPKTFQQISSEEFLFAVVDSKYRSTALGLISNAKLKIWRCTGSEYDSEWASNFDYIIWTDAEKPVRIFQPGLEDKPIIKQVPDIKVVDTIGAGDTFTAYIAAYLAANTTNGNISLEDILDAVEVAIEASIHVCTLKHTAVANIEV